MESTPHDMLRKTHTRHGKWTCWPLLLCPALVVGCATASLSGRGRQVAMVQRMKRADCANLGPVFGKGGGWFGGGWIPDQNLMEYASNDLRNKAAAKGATHVVFSTHQMGNTMGRYGGTTSTATLSGVAYRCPPGALPPGGRSPASAGLPVKRN